jgi:hypothetical protein
METLGGLRRETAGQGGNARHPAVTVSEYLTWWCDLLGDNAHMTVQPFALFTKPHCRINFQEVLIDLVFTGNARTEQALFQPFQSAPQFIDTLIALERQECVNFMKRQMTADKRLTRPFESVCILQVIVQPHKDGPPQHPLALHHRHLPPGQSRPEISFPHMNLSAISTTCICNG